MNDDYEVMMRMYAPPPQSVPVEGEGDPLLRRPAPVGYDDDMEVESQRTREADAQVEQMTEEQLLNDPTYQRLAAQLYDAFGKNDERLIRAPRRGFKGVSIGKQTPRDKAEWLTWQMSGFLNSLPKMAWDMSKLKDMPLKDVKAFSDALNMYDNTPLTGKQFMRGVGWVLPEMIFGGLGFTLIGRAVTKGLSKNIVKSRLQDIIRRGTNAIKGTLVGATEGSLYEAGLAHGRETIDSAAEGRPYDSGAVKEGAVMGAIGGGVLGGAVDAAPPLYRKGKSNLNNLNVNPAPIR